MKEQAKIARMTLSSEEADARLVEIDKGQQLAGHFPNADALGRARRILVGEITLEDAFAEIDLKAYTSG